MKSSSCNVYLNQEKTSVLIYISFVSWGILDVCLGHPGVKGLLTQVGTFEVLLSTLRSFLVL